MMHFGMVVNCRCVYLSKCKYLQGVPVRASTSGECAIGKWAMGRTSLVIQTIGKLVTCGLD